MELPEEYKKGFKDFLGVRVDLSSRPLIPREETEDWVREAIKEVKGECLDLFAGSGCIGLAILKNVPGSTCDFGDVERSFLEGIKKSAEENGIAKERFDLIKTDIFSNIKKKYDFVLANPPYVAESRADEVGEDVKEFEPAVALYGGNDGMELIRKFLKESKDYLKDNGVIYMEFDPGQKEEIEELVKEYSKYEFFKDRYDKQRYIRIEK
ncbi:MAG: HemK family protein methyltransferase [Candidatus Pacebacteria bacterium]|nr:HemK family protein methyltransferase [Candidatus Paceibacterota bacterium]